MFAFARRPEPQRRPIGEPGISEAEFDRIRARLRDERADHFASPIRGAALGPISLPPGHRAKHL